MGQSPESTSYNSDKQGVPFYQGNADFGAVYPNPRIWCNKPIKLAKENDILISVRAPVGALNFSKEECCIGRGLAAITLDSNDFLLEFIYWSLRTGVKELQSKSTGSTFKSINKKTLEEVRIPKISLKEQKDIIRNLTLLTNILAKYKHEIVFLDELVKARFVEMFGDPSVNPMNWDIVIISEVVKGKVSNGFFDKRDDYIDDGNVSVMGVAYIVNRMYSQWTDLPRTNGTDKDIEKYEVQYGDMLFCRSSLVAEGIGKASIVPENVPENILFECHVIRLPLDLSKCVPEFM